MNLTTIIATRGRPELLRQTVSITAPNMILPESRLLIAVDADDDATLADIAWLPSDPRIILSVEPREDTRGPKYDRALRLAPADVYMPVGDYTPIHMRGFDAAILQAAQLFHDGIGCVNTPLINASFPGIQAPTAKLVELMGYIYPPHFPFWFIDHWLDDIARMIGRYCTVDIDSDHTSFSGKRKTIGLRDVRFWADYFDLLTGERQAQASRIIDHLDEPETAKQRLRMNFPLVDFRSRWVNSLIGGLPDNDPPDERYMRVKIRALEHLNRLGLLDAAA